MYLILGDGDGASSIATNSFFGNGTGAMWLNDVTCRMHERRLLECNHQVNRRCTHADDAGVRCMEGGVS